VRGVVAAERQTKLATYTSERHITASYGDGRPIMVIYRTFLVTCARFL